MPLTNAGKKLVLDVFKANAVLIALGATPSTIYSTAEISWEAVSLGILNIPLSYTNVIGLRYQSGAVNMLQLQTSGASAILTLAIDDFPTNPATRGIYGIISMPVSIT